MRELEEKSFREAVEKSRTIITKAIFPGTTNHYDTLFGGTALMWMDEVAFICATRFTRKKVVTVSSSKIDFTKAIPSGNIVELVAQVTKVGTRSLVVHTTIYTEAMYDNTKELAVEGDFVFVTIEAS